ncbi:phage virion morphogenesis protein [Limnobaculum zhutongyuii]|uniref:Phage virion morphogenesis protein n=1 Tax=Limnobaculum zhutongyuii TaxID=2498113 RepID=A0A411WGP3_9GAMM|nr:phage virion morphogenesis protein [Limnobaculum zhutongyuii]QBH95471.1 phage virion morphogenesis protein [Limnobaculum zhutongyuii]TQS88840.1 phage virion morphogenesis protein [Limnobaculum zhutongyuii]
MVKIVIDITRTESALNDVLDSLEHREPLMREISGIMADAVEENFAQEGRPKWLPIKRDGKILQDKGHLASSITPFSDNDTAGAGSNLKYAAIQNNGGTTRPHVIRPRNKKALAFSGRFAKKVNHPGSKIPARTFLSLMDDDYDEIENTGIDYLSRPFD